jgi:hypothetical protein
LRRSFHAHIKVKWSAFDTHKQTRLQLDETVFPKVLFIDDPPRRFQPSLRKARTDTVPGNPYKRRNFSLPDNPPVPIDEPQGARVRCG